MRKAALTLVITVLLGGTIFALVNSDSQDLSPPKPAVPSEATKVTQSRLDKKPIGTGRTDPTTRVSRYKSNIVKPTTATLQIPDPTTNQPSSVDESTLPAGRYKNVVLNTIGSTKDITYKTRPAMKLVENNPEDYDLVDDLDRSVNLKLNMYYPENDPLSKRPLLIFVYGGGWWAGDRYQLESDAEYFAGLGYVTMTIDYTMFPGGEVLNPLPTVDISPYSKIIYESASDIYSAYQYALTNKDRYGIDSSRIGIGGWSAGGLISQALINFQALPKPYGVKAVLGLSNILQPLLSDGFELAGGLKTYNNKFHPVSMFASYDEDTGFAGTPNDHASDCAYLDSMGHNCLTVTYPGAGHELNFSLEPGLSTSMPFFSQYVAGY